jgi:hypothetical protein
MERPGIHPNENAPAGNKLFRMTGALHFFRAEPME